MVYYFEMPNIIYEILAQRVPGELIKLCIKSLRNTDISLSLKHISYLCDFLNPLSSPMVRLILLILPVIQPLQWAGVSPVQIFPG